MIKKIPVLQLSKVHDVSADNLASNYKTHVAIKKSIVLVFFLVKKHLQVHQTLFFETSEKR